MHFLDQTSSMDVRFYPAAAGSALPGDPSNLDFAQCLGYYNYNKVIIPAGVNSSCCCPGRFPADRSWGSVGAGRLGAGGRSEPGAGAPAALRGAGGCSAPESCSLRGRSGGAGHLVLPWQRRGSPRGTRPRAAARAVQRGASGRQPGRARGAILLPMAGEQRRVPSSQRSWRGQNSPNFPRAGAAAAPGASGRARWAWTALRGEDGAFLCSVLLAQSGSVRASS